MIYNSIISKKMRKISTISLSPSMYIYELELSTRYSVSINDGSTTRSLIDKLLIDHKKQTRLWIRDLHPLFEHKKGRFFNQNLEIDLSGDPLKDT